jgi:hypothetical protein
MLNIRPMNPIYLREVSSPDWLELFKEHALEKLGFASVALTTPHPSAGPAVATVAFVFTGCFIVM